MTNYQENGGILFIWTMCINFVTLKITNKINQNLAYSVEHIAGPPPF